MPRYQLGHFIDNIKTEKVKGIQEGRAIDLLYFKAFTPSSPPLPVGPKHSLRQTQPLKLKELFLFILGLITVFYVQNHKQTLEIIPVLIQKTCNSTIANQFIDTPSCCKTNSAWQPTMGENLLVNRLWQRDRKPHSSAGQPLGRCHLKAFPLGNFNYPFPQWFSCQSSL